MRADDDKLWLWFPDDLTNGGRGWGQIIISLNLKTDVSITRGQQRYTIGKSISSFSTPETKQTKDFRKLITYFHC